MRYLASCLLALLSLAAAAQPARADLLILGSDHLEQVYRKEYPATDVLTPKRQQELEALTKRVARYCPDMIMVEVLPQEQPLIDSLYALYVSGRVKPEDLPGGRSEVYQLAFRMGKALGLPRIHCVNAPGGTSQGILDNGTGIEGYRAEGAALRARVNEKYAALRKDSLSLRDYYRFLNRPETVQQVYHLRYMAPARVTHGRFTNPDAMVDTAFVNPAYIGAELTSVFRNRDYKIYSNIVTQHAHAGGKRLLLIIGVAHIGSLQSIFRDDPGYRLMNVRKYLR
ncbi:MAG: hypothetical protein EOO11_00355 [Chitinophagaceae bacterium]|nr:MAG: hypothetical protein EOO11_00355 [Chitinophagaceae bacterium]